MTGGGRLGLLVGLKEVLERTVDGFQSRDWEGEGR